jgi:ABC-2 type transport system ATP-binding protein
VSDPAIEATNLSKRYGSVTAVDGLDLAVEHGEIYGFLGPNGAGKSTTIAMLLDYARPSDGQLRVLGRDPQSEVVPIHQRLGVLPDRYGLYGDLTARRHIQFVGDVKDTETDPQTLLARVGLEDAATQQVDGFSQGMAQRLALAMALVGDPELLVLDEPFTGLDPHGVRRVREIVHEENDRGATVFFSSHVLGQVDLVCDRIGILADGRLVAEGSIEELRETTDADPSATVEDVFLAATDGSVSVTKTEGDR